MIFRRLFHSHLAQASYLIGCGASHEAIVIDPHRDVDLFLNAARAEGVRIIAVTETHVHADFLSGSHELAAHTGARLYLSGEGRGPWSYSDDLIRDAEAVLLHDRFVIRIGAVRIEVLHTPGHTPEHLTFLITDTAVADEPMGAVTGDFVFVGDIGRPDLLERAVRVTGSADAAAHQLYRSLGRLAPYPDYLQVWPGHGAGSACGRGLSAVPQSTLGYERRHNWALRTGDENAFVTDVLSGQPDAPAYFKEMKRLNANGVPPWREVMRPAFVAPDEVVAALARGTTVIDTRSADGFAAEHIPGTINIPFNRAFLTWVGSLVPLEGEVILIGEEAQLGQAVGDLGLIGFDHVVGYTGPDVVESWRRGNRALEPVVTASVLQVAPRLQSGGVTLLDVRSSSERAAEHIPGSVHIPLGALSDSLDQLDHTHPIVVHCQSGGRSAIAASVLLARGFTDVENLEGGLDAWRDAGGSVANDGVSLS